MMEFEPDKIVALPEGGHSRGSVSIAFIAGDERVTMSWAINALSIATIPNGYAYTSYFTHPNFDVAANLAVDDWRKREPKTELLLVMPASQCLRWNVMVETYKAMRGRATALRVGHAWLIPRTAEAGMFIDREWSTNWIALEDYEAEPVKVPRQATLGQLDERLQPERSIIFAIPTLGMTSLPWLVAARQMQSPAATAVYLAVIAGHEVGQARDLLVDAVLRARPRPGYLFFLGDDMLPPRSCLKQLFNAMDATDSAAVSGLYYVKEDVPQPILWRADKPGLLQPKRDFDVGDLVQVDGCGLDACLLRTEVLAEVPAPRFRTEQRMDTQGFMARNEDAFFWDKFVRMTKKRPVVDTGVRVGHYDWKTGRIF